MSKNDVNIGLSPNDNTGDPLRVSFEKLNNTLTELYQGLGDGSTLNLTLNSDANIGITGKVTSQATLTDDAATILTTKGYVDSQFNTADTLPEVLTRGNTTGGSNIAVSADDNITFTDSSEAIFGDDADLQIYHDGTNAKIVNSTGALNVSGGNVNISGGNLQGTTGMFGTRLGIGFVGDQYFTGEDFLLRKASGGVNFKLESVATGTEGSVTLECGTDHNAIVSLGGQLNNEQKDLRFRLGNSTKMTLSSTGTDISSPLTADAATFSGALTGTSGTFSDTVAFNSLKDTGENITVTKFVDKADGIINNDNDTTIPTSAAVVDYVNTTPGITNYKVIGLAMDYMSRVHNDGGVVEGMEQVMKNTEKLILA